MISAVVKCHLIDNELYRMTREAMDTIKPYVDELILIDHDSNVGSTWMKNVADIYHKFDEPKGFPMTASKGVELASNQHVAVLNNDIKFFGDWVTPLMRYKDYAIVHPKLIDWGNKVVTGNTQKVNMPPQHGMFFSAFILNKEPYEAIGGWDTDYDFWGFDDWDYYKRLLDAGYEALWTDEVAYWHKGGATIGKIGRDKFKNKNRKLFEKKHGIDPHGLDWSQYGSSSRE